MGVGSNGKASFFLRNSDGEFVVGVFHDQERGIIVLQNEAGDPIWSSDTQ